MIYTVLRLALFVVCWAAIAGVATLVFDDSTAVGIWSFIAGAVVSSALSLKFLAKPRERFARSVEARAARASARFEQIKTSEDAD
ncbi:MAG: hypothetical protein JWQ74_1131 [Marmoricola sp.]|nr:hypothetical protein [Marmoricola sp.]